MSAPEQPPLAFALTAHWDAAYERNGPSGVSWFQADGPLLALELIDAIGAGPGDIAVDVGGGGSALVDGLLERGVTSVSVLDISIAAIHLGRERLGDLATKVDWIHADVLAWRPTQRFTLWHDRAVFHFLTDVDDQARYVSLAMSSISPGGHLVIATFAPNGPKQCSGLAVARYGAAEIAEVFASGFSVVSAHPEVHITPSKNVQQFTWVVLRRKAEPTQR